MIEYKTADIQRREFAVNYPYIPDAILKCIDFSQNSGYNQWLKEEYFYVASDKHDDLTNILLLLGGTASANGTIEVPEVRPFDVEGASNTVAKTAALLWPGPLNHYFRLIRNQEKSL